MTPRAYERFRARLWSKVYVAVVAHPILDIAGAVKAADQAVKDFDARFKCEVQS